MGMTTQESVNPEAHLELLVREHKELKEKVRAFGARLYLTPEQQKELNQLKKLKLAKKDRIHELRAQLA